MKNSIFQAAPLTLALSLTLLAALPAQARWTSLGTKGSARIEVDAGSQSTPGENRVRLWYRETYATPKLPDSGAFSFTRLTTWIELQCDRRMARTLQLRYSAADGTELQTETPETREALPVQPDSALETVFRHACRPRPKPVAELPPPVPPPVVVEPAPTTKKTKNGKKIEPPPPPPPPPAWNYTGRFGADKWASLGKEYATCGEGLRQSPIDIRRTVRGDLPPLQFEYRPVPLSIVDDGHGIEVRVPESGTLEIEGESYALTEIRFHRPGEYQMKGVAYAMSAHLLHQSKSGKIAVVAIPIEAGKEHPLIRTLWSHLPLGQFVPATAPEIKIDPTQLLPAKRGYYTFLGSLTTPPCTEGVLWFVLKTPIQLSKEQLAGFATIYRNNARPVQPVNNRIIKESR